MSFAIILSNYFLTGKDEGKMKILAVNLIHKLFISSSFFVHISLIDFN